MALSTRRHAHVTCHMGVFNCWSRPLIEKSDNAFTITTEPFTSVLKNNFEIDKGSTYVEMRILSSPHLRYILPNRDNYGIVISDPSRKKYWRQCRGKMNGVIERTRNRKTNSRRG